MTAELSSRHSVLKDLNARTDIGSFMSIRDERQQRVSSVGMVFCFVFAILLVKDC